MRVTGHLSAPLLALLLLSACATGQVPPRVEELPAATPRDIAGTANAAQMLRSSQEDPLPDPEKRSGYRRFIERNLGNIDAAAPFAPPQQIYGPLAVEEQIHRADFITPGPPDNAALLLRRNIMARLAMAESTRLCGRYLELLSETDREGNFVLGSAATLFGGLGAIFTPAATARALAGLAGISSGLQKDFNGAFFYGAGSAISQAIDAVRTREFGAIVGKLEDKGLPYSAYPYAAAFQEITGTHRRCSLNGAFAEIGKALGREQREARETDKK